MEKKEIYTISFTGEELQTVYNTLYSTVPMNIAEPIIRKMKLVIEETNAKIIAQQEQSKEEA